MSTVPLAECFGPTIQGEGPAAGRPATFIRFGGCNLSCTWCDTPYTWDAGRFNLREQITRREVADVVAAVTAPIAVITGGEPLLHQQTPGWVDLLEGLNAAGREIHLETNGTITPTADTRQLVTLAVVSPKLPHADAGQRTGARVIVPEALRAWADRAHAGGAALKVVVRDLDDCAAVLDLAQAHGWPLGAVWLMPEGTTPGALAARWRDVCDYAAAAGVNASHRLHVLAWNDERGH